MRRADRRTKKEMTMLIDVFRHFANAPDNNSNNNNNTLEVNEQNSVPKCVMVSCGSYQAPVTAVNLCVLAERF
jgi:hypothetical protein